MSSALHTAKSRRDIVSSLVDSIENLKISTLVNAAKISPHVQERTIGPKGLNGLLHGSDKTQPCNTFDSSHISSVAALKNCNNNNETKSAQQSVNGKFRHDVWHEVNIQSEIEQSPRNMLHLNDCKAIKFRLAVNNAEKQRRAKISTDLQEKQCQWDSELEQRLQQIRIDSAENQKQIHAKRLERERQTLKAIEQIEAEAKQDEIENNAKKTEMIEHSRKLIEHANQLKRQDEIRLLIESINASKILFINLFELYAKTIINNQTLLNDNQKLAECTEKRDALLKRYEDIMKLINSKSISLGETELFEKLCQDLKQEQIDLNQLIHSHREASNHAASEDAAKAKYAVNLQTGNGSVKCSNSSPHDVINQAPDISVPDGVPNNRQSITVIGSSANNGTESRISVYSELINYYQDYKAQIQPLIADVNMKKFRFNCQKGVNTPVNSITAVSVQHLQDKFEKISDLLSGNQVRTGDIQFTASEHPLGIKYCTFLLAKKFITQGTTVTSSHASASFPIAAIIVAIWQLFPDFGKLFLALLYIECPFFVPCIPPKRDLDENEYLSLIGYKFNDNKLEEQEQYLKRISGLQRLYSAVLITKLKRNQQHIEHPHSLKNGWIWFTNFLMLDPLPGISSTLLLEFIQICGLEMWQIYKKQFMKLLILLHTHYLNEKLEKVDSGGPYSRLKDLVNTIVSDNKITPPCGTLPPNFF